MKLLSTLYSCSPTMQVDLQPPENPDDTAVDASGFANTYTLSAGSRENCADYLTESRQNRELEQGLEALSWILLRHCAVALDSEADSDRSAVPMPTEDTPSGNS